MPRRSNALTGSIEVAFVLEYRDLADVPGHRGRPDARVERLDAGARRLSGPMVPDLGEMSIVATGIDRRLLGCRLSRVTSRLNGVAGLERRGGAGILRICGRRRGRSAPAVAGAGHCGQTAREEEGAERPAATN